MSLHNGPALVPLPRSVLGWVKPMGSKTLAVVVEPEGQWLEPLLYHAP